jgi:hypothetical protein
MTITIVLYSNTNINFLEIYTEYCRIIYILLLQVEESHLTAGF